jgi:hypothetical protein
MGASLHYHNQYPIASLLDRNCKKSSRTMTLANVHIFPQMNTKTAKKTKTYNSGYSLVVTDPTTNPPIWSLCMAERTGCPVLSNLWSYVLDKCLIVVYIEKFPSWEPKRGWCLSSVSAKSPMNLDFPGSKRGTPGHPWTDLAFPKTITSRDLDYMPLQQTVVLLTSEEGSKVVI